MADKKNIVIKVKYPTSLPMSENDVPLPKTITVWNVKRVLIAVTGIALVLFAGFYLSNKDTENVEPEKPLAIAPELSAKPAPEPKKEVTSHVLRSVLSYKVVNSEPVDEITLPLKLSKKKSTWIYYFVELKGMKDKTVYHEWLLDGVLISRKKVNISNDTWRTSSRQVFKFTSDNNWTVRLVDETGGIINEKHLNVIYE
jgi:hypothetical protein